VLWIDDTIGDAEVRLLELEGFEITCVQTGVDGVALASGSAYDVVLLDLRLGSESGLEVLQSLTAAGVTAPIVMLTAFADVESAVTAMKLGASDYLMKSLEVEDTAAFLRRVVAAGPREIAPPRAPLTEIEWLRVQCNRLAACLTRDELFRLLVQTLVDRRVTLPSFFGCASSIKLVLSEEEPSLALLAARIRRNILEAANTPLPRHHKLAVAVAALERDGIKQGQESLAGRIGLSRAYLSRLMSKQTGRHASEWCRAAVARAAVRQLLQTTQPVSQIAYAVGYEHVAQFDHDFMSMFGVSPTALRRLARP
jgi:ActR/RegA family two-component response regulator/AraC-like DNA-binding protein